MPSVACSPQTHPHPVLQGWGSPHIASPQTRSPSGFCYLPGSVGRQEPQTSQTISASLCLPAPSDMVTLAVPRRGSSSSQCVCPLPPLSHHLLDLVLWQNHLFPLSLQLEDGSEFPLGAHLWASSPPHLALQGFQRFVTSSLYQIPSTELLGVGFLTITLIDIQPRPGGTLFFDLQLSFPTKNLEDQICSKSSSLNDT